MPRIFRDPLLLGRGEFAAGDQFRWLHVSVNSPRNPLDFYSGSMVALAL